jgi:threonine dehydrogenase-like Zn-dependent dehydrogenase
MAMRAVSCQHGELSTVDLDEPRPGTGQVRIRTLRCGICGSDLHARTGIDEWAKLTDRLGYKRLGRSHESLIFGHEFCGEVLEYGPGCREYVPSGTPVVALPLIRAAAGIDTVGLSPHAPGAYAEQLLVQESLMLPVPNGLSPDIAALTEPMAVALHAVRRGELAKRDVAIVIGCGPVGLAVIMLLKAHGVRTVVASDFSPRRRELARTCGADIVCAPDGDGAYDASVPDKLHRDLPATLELAVGSVERLQRLPGGWWNGWRLADRLGLATPKRPVIFECVGVPGVLESVIQGAPLFSRVVVVGVCVGEDHITPAQAINKELELRFVIGYTPLEFREMLMLLAEGKVQPAAMLTGRVGLDGVAAAFAALGDPEVHAKILIDPASPAQAPVPWP